MKVLRCNGRESVVAIQAVPAESVKAVGLRYVTGQRPGITRRRRGKGMIYVDADGKQIRDQEVLCRIKSLVIPPAWTAVWICPLANGHLQATGRDTRGRKQYRYHSDYRALRDQTKFRRMIAFGTVLPKIREQVEADLRLHGLPKRKVLATVLRLLESTCIRIGNEEYEKQNHSFGLTTLHNRHVQIEGRKLHFHFRGKSGQEQNIELRDDRLARIVQKLHDLPGYALFEYLDDDGRAAKIDSENVNAYLRGISGEDFTAKDFRTWMGTGLAALALESVGEGKSRTQIKRNIVAAIKATARRLGNHPPACRKYYVHPAILEAYSDGTLFSVLKNSRAGRLPVALRREEVAVMSLVKVYEKKLLKTADKKAA